MDSDLPRKLRLCLCGDVMTGRGIDQVLPNPGNPRLHEPSSRELVQMMAERGIALAHTTKVT